jgi:hypothetical protein
LRRENRPKEEKTADNSGLLSITGTKKREKNAKKDVKKTKKRECEKRTRQSVMSA